MNAATWSQVDHYLADSLVQTDPALDAAITESERAGLPSIQVSANQGKLLHLLARMHGARRVLEIGTLGGYSSIWLARALPAGGRLITLEADPKHAEVARANLARAGLDAVVELRLGKALDTLPTLGDGAEPFDFFFIDADKQNIAEYFAWSLRLARRGSVIVVDNVVRAGAVADAGTQDTSALGVRRFYERFGRDPRVSITAVQTVGSKGYDGFALAVVTGDPS